MSWPQATDYNAAVQNPQVSFADPDLRRAEAVGDLFGLPRPHSGNFADVYQLRLSGGPSWAVKCFTREVNGLRERYHAVSEHLRQVRRVFMVEFDYLEEGIRIGGKWYPVVKMRWVEGLRLNEFVSGHLDKPVLLDRLAQMWLRLAQELREARLGHGDLQHGNVLLVPGTSGASLGLRLVDYDGLFVPALADRPSGEAGHPHYQHPDRLRDGYYGGEVDRFSHLVIYTALRCLVLGGRHLWDRYDNGDNLLFREDDFRAPGRAPLFRELWGQRDLAVRALVGHLILAAKGPLDEVPLLQDLAGRGAVQPLTALEEARVRALLQGVEEPALAWGRAAPRDDIPVRVVVPVFPGQPVPPPVPPPPPAPARSDTLADVSMAETVVAVPVLPPARLPARPPTRPRRPENEEPRTENRELRTEELSPPPHSRFSVLGSRFLISLLRPWRPGGSLSRYPRAVGMTLVLVPLTWLVVALCRPGDPPAPLPPLGPPEAGPMKGVAQSTPDKVSEQPAGGAKTTERAATVTVEKPSRPEVLVKGPLPLDAGGSDGLTLEIKKPAAAAPPAPVPPARLVSFATADGVTVRGTFYPVARAQEAVCVLLLHGLGGGASEGWKELAEALQARGHAVLDFDFRGHGRSTGFSPRTFWRCRENTALRPARIRPSTPMPAALNVVTFPPHYYPWLVQDVAAARMFLEKRNDAGEVNSARLVLLGAGEGATLGALWLVWECCRYEPDPAARPGARRHRPDPEARDVLAALWIRMEPTLGGAPMPRLPEWLGAAGRQHIPMKFLYPEQDVLFGRAPERFVQALGPEARDLPLTGAVALRGKAPFGQTLLPEDPEVRTVVLDYVHAVSKQPGLQAWSRRGATRPFAWVLPGGREIAGRVKDVLQPVPVHQGR
jgi:hypothetical protein